MEKIHLCQRCMKPIEAGHSEAKYCNKCRAEVHAESWITLKEKRRQTLLENNERARKEKEEREKRRYKGPSVREINDVAKARGLSYGQYVSKYGSVII